MRWLMLRGLEEDLDTYALPLWGYAALEEEAGALEPSAFRWDRQGQRQRERRQRRGR